MKNLFLFFLFLFLSVQLFSVSHCNWYTELDSEIRTIKAHNNYLYIITLDENLLVYDAISSSNPSLIASYPELSEGKLFFDGDRLYRSYIYEIYCYDISDPENITELGQIHVPESIVELGVGRIFIKDNLLSVSSWAYYDRPHSQYGETYTDIFEIVDYNTIEFLHSIYAGSDGEIESRTFFINDNNYLYTSTDEYNLLVYDCSDFTNITYIDDLNIGRTQFVSSEYIVNYTSEIYFLESPTAPVFIADYDVGTTKAWQLDDQLVLNYNNNNTYFFDLQTQEIVSSYSSYNYKSECMEDCLFLGFDRTLLRIDISNHENPDEIYTINNSSRRFTIENDLIFYDNYTSISYGDLTAQDYIEYNIDFTPGSYSGGYLTDGSNLLIYELDSATRLKLYSLEDPENYTLELDFELSNIGYPFYISENLVYCANGYEMNIIDLADPQPENSITTITFENEYYYPELLIDSDIMYMFRSNYCAVLNISDLQNPSLVTEQFFTYEGGTPDNVEMIGSYIYLFPHNNYTEIYTYDFSSPLEPELVSITNFGVHLDAMYEVENKLLLSNNELNRIYTCDIVENHPQISNEYSWNNRTYDLAQYDGNLLVATQEHGIIALSTSITPKPTIEVPAQNGYLLTNYPNPFNPTTTISFELNTETTENTEIEIYNVKGQKVVTLSAPMQSECIEGRQGQASYTTTWNGTDQNNNPVTSGVYLYQLKVDGEVRAAKKCLLLK